MKKEFLEAGKIVGTHGVRGMIRINPWSDSGEFLSRFKSFYIGNEKTPVKVKKISPHGRVCIAQIDGIDSIEQAEALRGKVLFIKRDDAVLDEGRYFIEEIIGSKVYDAKSKELLGILKDVSPTGANDVWHIERNGKEYLVPAIEDVIVSVDIESEVIEINVLKGIFDDED